MTLRKVTEALAQRYADTLAERAERDPSAWMVMLRAQPVWDGPAVMKGHATSGVREVLVRPGVSALAIRAAMQERAPGQLLLVLTDRPKEDLGLDIQGRAVSQQVMSIDLWNAVREAFEARTMDPALKSETWAQELLIERAPAEGWPVAISGTLTRDHALSHLAATLLGLPSADIDASGLLLWSLDAQATTAWRALSGDVRKGLTTWIRSTHGDVAALALQIAAMPHQVDAVSLGVVADVLYPWDRTLVPEAGEARIRLETFTGIPSLDWDVARQWGDVARGVVFRLQRDGDLQRRNAVLSRAELAFTDLRWPNGASFSTALEAGYRSRLRDLASAIRDSLAYGGRVRDVEESFSGLLQHDLAQENRRTDQARMAVRLARWLALPDPEAPTTLAAAMDRHVGTDAWVDRAVADVWVGVTDDQIASVWADLVTAARERRRVHDRRTAALLADVVSGGALPAQVLGVERLVADVVRPMASARGVLLIVVDGMTAAVAAEVVEDTTRLGWFEAVPDTTMRRSSVLAALPTLTTCSRTSLFTGRLTTGQQADEKAGFPAISGGGIVFHKSDLVGGAGEELPGAVREAIRSERAMVAVVLNTVDDALAKHDPGGTDWNLASIRHLQALLEQAAEAGRTVVITSDHGHVVERGSEMVTNGAAVSARWRPADSGPVDADREVLLRGSRVLLADGAVVVPWVEDLRYTGKQAGYHGGASAAEITIPVIVLVRDPESLADKGWVAAPPQSPDWWHDMVVAPESSVVPTTPPAHRKSSRASKPTEVTGQDALLPAEDLAASTQAQGEGDLIDALMASPVFSQQRARAGARALPDDRVAAMLRALVGGSGRVHRDTLAAAAGIPIPRITQTLTMLRRQLNVEGYDVVGVDADGVTVTLDIVLLREQFDIAGRP